MAGMYGLSREAVRVKVKVSQMKGKKKILKAIGIRSNTIFEIIDFSNSLPEM